jgi:hypothetical protein
MYRTMMGLILFTLVAATAVASPRLASHRAIQSGLCAPVTQSHIKRKGALES